MDVVVDDIAKVLPPLCVISDDVISHAADGAFEYSGRVKVASISVVRVDGCQVDAVGDVT